MAALKGASTRGSLAHTLWWLPLLVGLVATALSTWAIDRSNRSALQAQTDQLAGDVEAVVRERFNLFQYGLRGARGAVVTAPGEGFNRRAFERYSETRDVAREFPGALGFGFIRKVPSEQEGDFLTRARADGAPNFAIRTLSPHDGDRFVIQYIYPAAGNEGATGLDIASEANRRTAALAAAREGEVQLTAPITLVQADGKPRRGFLALLPVYPPGAPLLTPEARQGAVIGWSYAPLLVDDVLADLGKVMGQISLQLTQAGEAAPFFSSAGDAPSGAPPLVVSRDIVVMGQRWTMNVQPRLTMRDSLHLWSPWLSIWLGLALTAVGVLVIHGWQRNGYTAASRPGESLGLRAFMRSSPVRRLWPPAALVLLLALAAGGGQIWESHLKEIDARLMRAAESMLEQLRAEEESLRRDVLFLASTPPITGLARALPTGTDAAEGSPVAAWEEQLANTFVAFMRATSDALQVRLIKADAKGREWVKVLRDQDRLLRLGDDALQDVGGEPYVIGTLSLAPGQVRVSDINLNRTAGVIDRPHRPTWRFSTPVQGADGALMGVVVINMQADEVMRRVAASVPVGVEVYAISASDDFLMHPDGDRTFGAELGQPYGFADEFKHAHSWLGMYADGLSARQTRAGDVLAREFVYRPEGPGDSGLVRIVVTIAEAEVYKGMAIPMLLLLFGLASLSLLGASMQYLGWVRRRQSEYEARSHQDQQAQHREGELFKALLDSAPDASIIVDEKGVIEFVNAKAESQFGYDRADLLGHHINMLLPVRDRQAHQSRVSGFIAAPVGRQMSNSQQLKALRADGTEFAVEISLGPVQTETRRLVAASVRDVTERNRAAEVLKSINDRLAVACESAAIGVWEYDLEAGSLLWDAQMYRLYGCEPTSNAEPYTLWSNHLHPDDRMEAEQCLNDAIAGTREFDTLFRIRLGDGRIRHLKANALVVRDANGKAMRMIGVNRDITEELITAKALEANEGLLRRVGRLASVGGWRVDLKSGKVEWSNQTRLIHEVPPEFVPDLATGISFYAPEHRDVIEQAVQHAIATGTPWDLELRLITYTGNSIWVRAQGEVEFDNGLPVSLVGAFQDITARIIATIALTEAKKAADAASLAKGAFLANTSHEIRTPLNAIIGIGHLLGEEALTAEQLSLVKKIQLSGRALLGIVNDVLDLSKIEANEMTVNEAPCQLPELLEELVAVLRPQAEAKSLQLKVELSPSLPVWVATDALRLGQILNNLLGNALKFTSIGEIRLIAETLPADRGQSIDRTRVRFRVTDTGIGISPEAQRRLFQPFVQADTTTTRRFGGTGLGLSIVSKLVALLGGEVGVESHEGVGSVFSVTLVLRLPDEREVIAHDSETPALSLMIAEDDPNDAKQLQQIARTLGWRVQMAANGAELVDAYVARMSSGLRLPDALLLDWQMPVMDGLVAIHTLAERVGPNKLPAVLMVSAFDAESIVELDHKKLVSRVLHKPVDSSQLFNALNDVVTQHTGDTRRVLQATQTEALKARWLPDVRLLVVDDSEINLEVVGKILERNGAQVATANSGEEALALLRAEPDGFDAVLMDVQMPHMDGLEAARRVRQQLGLVTLPIIALTAGALVEERRRAMEAGMNDFLTKPVDPSQLINRLRIAVERYRGKSLPIASLDNGKADDVPWPTVKGLDGESAQRLLSGDRDLFMSTIERLLTDYLSLETAPSQTIDLPDAAAQRLEIAALVHRLRSASGMVGATRMHELAASAEKALRTPGQPAHPILAELAETLIELRRQSVTLLADWRAQRENRTRAATQNAENTPLGATDLLTLRGLLATNDLSALGWVEAHSIGLRDALGVTRFEALGSALQNLDFKSALPLLEPFATNAGASL